jgi:hypothetical protein
VVLQQPDEEVAVELVGTRAVGLDGHIPAGQICRPSLSLCYTKPT